MSSTAIDEAKLYELLGRLVTDLGGSFHAANAVIGDRLGLYRRVAGGDAGLRGAARCRRGGG